MLAAVDARKSADPERRKRHLIESDFNQLLSLTGPSGTTIFQYDANGNQTQKAEPTGTTTYTWDARDRLTQQTTATGTSRFGYDTNNLRVFVQDSHGSRRVLVDGVEELAEYDASSGVQRARFDHDLSRVDGLLAQVSDQGKSFFIGDALGSVYGLADSAAATTARYSYDAYGTRSALFEQASTNWGFTGRRQDRPGTVYSRARYLDTSAGVFAGEDPFNFRGAQLFAATDGQRLRTNRLGRNDLERNPNLQNRYAYGLANPIGITDPSGEACFWDCFKSVLHDEVYGLATILGLTVAAEIFREFLLFLQSSGTNPNLATGTFDAVIKVGLLGYGIQFVIQNLSLSFVSFLITISTFALFVLLIGMVVLLIVDAIFCLVETQT